MKIKMFGVMRKFADPHGNFEMQLTEPVTVSKFKTALKHQLKAQFPELDEELVEQSAVANEDEVLQADQIVQTMHQVAVLPPVCGG